MLLDISLVGGCHAGMSLFAVHSAHTELHRLATYLMHCTCKYVAKTRIVLVTHPAQYRLTEVVFVMARRLDVY